MQKIKITKIWNSDKTINIILKRNNKLTEKQVLKILTSSKSIIV